MTETSGFMDPGTYDAAQFARSLYGIINDGFQDGYLNELEVIANTPNGMNVLVKTGAAWVQGCWYTSDAVNTLTIDAAHATLDRIDRIILRKTATTSITAVVLKGTAAASPAAPTLTQVTDGVWEISLAQVLVTHAVTSIAGTGTTLITDERTQSTGKIGALTIATATGHLDMASHKITSLTDPTSAQDADTKAARDAAITTATGALAFTNTYGDGSDGAIHITSDTGSYEGVYEATTFVVDATKTLTLTGNTIIMATTSITINGTILGTGASEFAGGVGATTDAAGGSAPGSALFSAGAKGGEYGADTDALGTVLCTTYPNYGLALSAPEKRGYHSAVALMNYAMLGNHTIFSTASGGGGNSSAATCVGGTGGKGGAWLFLVAPIITLAATTGYITLNGATGGAATSSSSQGAGGGGGGCGGILVLVGRTITISGTVSTAAGAGGAGSYNGSPWAASNGADGTAGETITFTV